MATGIPREAEWGIGVAFIVGMVIALILAIQAFEGPVSVILLVVGGVFLLVGLYFLTGTQRPTEEIGAAGAATSAAGKEPAAGAPLAPAAPHAAAPAGPTFTPAAAQRTQKTIVVCPGCRMRVANSFQRCPHCGTAL